MERFLRTAPRPQEITDGSLETPNGVVAGTWRIDPAHSEVSFSVRHMMISKVRGRFGAFSGQIVTADDPASASLSADIDLASIDTGNADRDTHLRSPDYLDVAAYPTMTYRSSAVQAQDGGFVVDGELSVHGVRRPVQLAVEVNGVTPDAFGDTRAGFSATAEIDRRDFGITTTMPMDGGGVVVGEKIAIALEVEAVLEK